MGPERYLKAYGLLKNWVQNGLDIYKVSSAATGDPGFPSGTG